LAAIPAAKREDDDGGDEVELLQEVCLMNMRIPMMLVALCVCLPAMAGVQKCKDASGKVFYSDRGCPSGENMRAAPGESTHTIATQAGDDDVAQRCMEHVRGRTGIGTADTTRLENYRVKWVSVRDVGARRLFSITVAYRNPAGYWGETQQHECLLRGDNTSFQTTPYELVN
jgi:hypothetical protein